MKRMRLLMLLLMVSLLCAAFPASAELLVIGTASYDSDGNGAPEEYKLIYMTDGPFGPVTWLDYTRGGDTYQNQVNWADGLGFQTASITPAPGYTQITNIGWSSGWRLPLVDESKLNPLGDFGYEGPDESGYHNYRFGCNMINGEMSYLYYEELGNKCYRDTNGKSQSGSGIVETGDFENLLTDAYWSGTDYSPDPKNYVYYSEFERGSQFSSGYKRFVGIYALAVFPGDVSAAVPEPGTFLLFGAGLAGLGAWRNKFRRRLR